MEFNAIWDDPLLVCTLPKEINLEIKEWVDESIKIKNHPLSEYKAHNNVGYCGFHPDLNANAYQCSVPSHLVINSFWLAYTLRLCASHWGGEHKMYSLAEYRGHFDSFDIWTNFSYKGNYNPPHIHATDISGIIYYQSLNHPTRFPQVGKTHESKDGTMVLFKSDVEHRVGVQKDDGERITIAFNISKVS